MFNEVCFENIFSLHKFSGIPFVRRVKAGLVKLIFKMAVKKRLFETGPRGHCFRHRI